MIKRTIRDIKIINAIKRGETKKSIRSSMSYKAGGSGGSSASAFHVQPKKSKAFLKVGLNQSKGGKVGSMMEDDEDYDFSDGEGEDEEDEESKTDSLQDEVF